KNLKNQLLEKLEKAEQIEALTKLEVEYLGRNGLFNTLFKDLKKFDATLLEKKTLGQKINFYKHDIETIIQKKKLLCEKLLLESKIKKEEIDITLPSLQFPKGYLHPLNQTIEKIENFFLGLGYFICNDTELVSDLYNFEMLNMDKDHPARDMQDSFYLDEQNLLRTHTSSAQIKAMLNHNKHSSSRVPLKMISSGKVYRRDRDNETHSHQFTQLEGFVVDYKISLIDLKNIIISLINYLFGSEQKLRFRPSYFPFTKPSLEVDLFFEDKKENQKYYLEIMGAGLIHPQVLINGGFNPRTHNGFAFGLGIERITMLLYGIKDIRNFYNNDLRFLNQFTNSQTY
ncbi:phenylalanine--tRNA ligase subunit alpha, partial [Candidatus Phytoplasma phoenicium]